MPQSNSNLQSYAKLPAAKNNSPKIPQISQNISLRLSFMLTQIQQIQQKNAGFESFISHKLAQIFTNQFFVESR